jgi:DNA polymerase I-like protein with 3'-5' exonuclease and polymerase domains|tara:strand:- start:417 stop:2294 length:1878 start_codon:yes stop_codon:yes gene_type:complete
MSHQLNFIYSDSDWVCPSEYPDLRAANEVAIDLETKDPDLKKYGAGWAYGKGHIVGFAVAALGKQYYFPIAHDAGGNMDLDITVAWMQDLLKQPSTKIFHNAAYDLGWLKFNNFEVNGPIVDTMIAAALIDENRWSFSLNACAKDYLGEIKNETFLNEKAKEWGIDAKQDLWRMPAGYVGFYAEQDAGLTLRLWQRFKAEIQQQSLNDVWEMEMQLLPILHKMRATGIRVDEEKASRLKKEFKQKESQLLSKIKKQTTLGVDIWAARSVAQVFDRIGVDYPRTPKSDEPSFTTNWLANCEHPVAKLIKEAREINKFHSTFIDSIQRYVHKGRIHAEINQLRSDQGGTVSGRLSYANPNLQQIPARNKEFGNKIRSLFLPEEGQQWGSFDYSQQEPRLVAHYSSAIGQKLDGSDEFIQAYQDESADFHQIVADMAQISRTQAKTINLGLFYGMGKNKLSKELGISKDKAEILLNQYNSRVPFVKKLAEAVTQSASKFGFIRTIKGRKCRFDKWEPATFGMNQAMNYNEAKANYGNNIRRAFTYKALNRLIQGSAADQAKQAMIDCHNAGYMPMLQIHDELCFSIYGDDDIIKIKNEMENSIENLRVPFKVDVAQGNSWGETHDNDK